MANMIASSFNLPFPLPYAKSLIHPSFLPPLLSSPFFNGNPKHIIRLTIRTHIALFSLSITTPLHLVMYIHTYIHTYDIYDLPLTTSKEHLLYACALCEQDCQHMSMSNVTVQSIVEIIYNAVPFRSVLIKPLASERDVGFHELEIWTRSFPLHTTNNE